MPEVRALKDMDANIFSEIVIEETVADIDRHTDLAPACNRQSVNPPVEDPDIEANAACDLNFKMVERAAEFESAAGNELGGSSRSADPAGGWVACFEERKGGLRDLFGESPTMSRRTFCGRVR